jgi:hypothetical protein
VGKVQVVDEKNKKKAPPEEHIIVISTFRVRLLKKGKVKILKNNIKEGMYILTLYVGG